MAVEVLWGFRRCDDPQESAGGCTHCVRSFAHCTHIQHISQMYNQYMKILKKKEPTGRADSHGAQGKQLADVQRIEELIKKKRGATDLKTSTAQMKTSMSAKYGLGSPGVAAGAGVRLASAGPPNTGRVPPRASLSNAKVRHQRARCVPPMPEPYRTGTFHSLGTCTLSCCPPLHCIPDTYCCTPYPPHVSRS